MYNSKKALGLVIIAFIAAFAWLSLRSVIPSTVVKADKAPNSFSAERALAHIKVIAKETHSSGTPAHAAVREYIYNYCLSQGLETYVQEGIGTESFGGRTVAGAAKNVIAKLKGISNGKAILVASHYDSQPNTPGATDDGSGVAAMLEAISLLKKGGLLQNDVIFLFTDMEEIGQLGANVFANDPAYKDKIGLVLNYDTRGNSGLCFTYETSARNGWVIKEFSKAVNRPVANSLAYEVYKRMPNYTDFTTFKNMGVAGLNSAFIDGFSNYHSMTDTYENVNAGSLQHLGDNMLESIRHFGNLKLEQTKSRDAIFFNPIGSWLMIYSITWDHILFVLALLLFGAFLALGYRKRKINTVHLLAGTGLYLGSILLTTGLVWLLQRGVLAAYPHYSNFYSANFYNANYYLLAITGISMLAFALLFSRPLKRFSADSVFAGSLLVLVLLIVGLKLFMPTASYVLYIPLIPVLLISSILMLADINSENKPGRHALGQMLMLVAALGLWIPLVYNLFIVFSLSFPFAAAILLCLFFPLLVPALGYMNATNKRLLPALALAMLVGGVAIAHFTSDYTKDRPLQTQMMYALNLDSNKAIWVSGQRVKDKWNAQYLIDKNRGRFSEFYPNANMFVWKSQAEAIKVDTAKVQVLTDSVISGNRMVTVRVQPGATTNSFELLLPENAKLSNIGNRSMDEASRRIVFHAPPAAGVEIGFSLPQQDAVALELIDRRIGLPENLLRHKLPDYMVYGPGYMSNTTQIRQTVLLNKQPVTLAEIRNTK
jgi:hypothetical protein